MTRFFLLLLVAATLLSLRLQTQAQDGFVNPDIPDPEETVTVDDITVDLYFETIKQGRVGIFRVTGDDIDAVRAVIFAREMPLYQRGAAYFGLISVNMTQAARGYQMDVEVIREDGETVTVAAPVFIDGGNFVTQNVIMPPDLLDLLDRELEDRELELLFDTAAPSTDAPMWGATGFGFPVSAELTSPFGAERIFNEDYPALHTGWDFQAVYGAPIFAVASGEVDLAQALPIRGNHVIVDHGLGVYSGYSHLSVVFVTQGQSVSAGQIIGYVGSTGRSSSAHAHVEFIVDGNWVDPVDFIQMYVP